MGEILEISTGGATSPSKKKLKPRRSNKASKSQSSNTGTQSRTLDSFLVSHTSALDNTPNRKSNALAESRTPPTPTEVKESRERQNKKPKDNE